MSTFVFRIFLAEVVIEPCGVSLVDGLLADLVMRFMTHTVTDVDRDFDLSGRDKLVIDFLRAFAVIADRILVAGDQEDRLILRDRAIPRVGVTVLKKTCISSRLPYRWRSSLPVSAAC